MKQLFLAGYPRHPSEFVSFTHKLEKRADEILESDDRLRHLNLAEEYDGRRAIEKIEGDQASQSWHAYTMGGAATGVREAIAQNDASKAAWWGYLLGTTRGLTITSDALFQQTLWRGYLANQVVYESAAAASHTPAEAEAIKQLEPLFSKQSESVLHTWVESKLPIGPRIGVTKVPEEILGALAKWHLALFDRKREERARMESERRAGLELRIKWLSLGVAGAVGLATLVATLKVFSAE